MSNIDVVTFTNKIHGILQGTVQVFNGFVNGLDWELLGTKFSQLTVGLTGAVADAIKSVDWSTLGKGISDFFANIDLSQMVINFVSIFTNAIVGLANMLIAIDWKMVGQKLGNAIKDGLNTILTAIKNIDWEAIGKSIGDFIFSIDWLGIAVKLLQILAQGISAGYDIIIGIVKSLIDAILNIDWGELGKNIVDLIVVGLELLADYVFGIFTKAIEFVLNIDWKSVGTNILNWIQQGLQSFNEWIENLFNKALNGIKKIFSGIGAWFKNTVWENGIKAAFSNVTSWFQNTFSKAWNAVKNVFSSGGKIFDGIKDGILSTFKTVVNGIIGGINKVITIPFNGINNALSRIKNISILGNKPFNGLINTISVPQIPMLAKGAVIPPNAKFLAMLGDQTNGRNLEAPESLIRKIVREESGNNNREFILSLKAILECDKKQFGELSLEGIRLKEEQNGKKYLVN